MPEATTKPHELEELQEQQRQMVQLRQLDSLEIVSHVGKKLGLGRKRLEKTWQDAKQLPEGTNAAEAGEDMGHILARDMTLNINEAPKPQPLPAPAPTPAVATEPPKSKWPMAAALALGLGVPGTTGLLMAPQIIQAFRGAPPVVNVSPPPEQPEYAPILLPGKPQGAK